MTIAVALPAARPRGDGVRWSASLALVLALHVAAVIALVTWHVPGAPPAMPPAAIMIDLAPVPAAPAPVVEPEKPVPQAAPEEPVAPPPPRPIERPVHRPLPHPTPVPRVTAPPQTTLAPEAAPVPVAPAPAPQPQIAPATQPSAMPSFEALLVAHLDRYKRYPRASQMRGEQGVALLRFTMDRQGRVLGFRLEQGSGHAALDEEVLALIRRAEPLPPFPPEIAVQQLELVVPVRFWLR
jgi:periplasmic protein TonB